MNKPKIFIGSSSERKRDAEELQAIINEWSDPEVWSDLFSVSKTAIENLETKLPKFDMCVFLWTSDDVASIRGQELLVARDNLIFETGLSYGYLGRQNTVIVREKDTKEISDLHGITYINHDFSQAMRILATKLRQHYDEVKNETKKTHTKKGKLDFGLADEELERFGIYIRRRLESYMLDDEFEEFINCLKKYVTVENTYILAEDFYSIASMCVSMRLYPHALQILDFARECFPKDDDIIVKLIETYTYIDNPDNKNKAKQIMETHFCIEKNESGMPNFTSKSKSKGVAYSENLQKIFRVYLMNYEYDELLSIINSYEKLNLQAKNNMVTDSYKAFAKLRLGDTAEALALYKELVVKYPNEDDIRKLGIMFFNTDDLERGYQIYELIALTRFASDTLLGLAYKMANHRICRTEKGFESTRIGKHIAKKIIVPILFKAIDLSPNEDTIREVKIVLQGIGGRDEFDFIQKHNHVPQDMFNILFDKRKQFYDWSNLKYIEDNKLNRNDIGVTELNKHLNKRIISIIEETALMNKEE